MIHITLNLKVIYCKSLNTSLINTITMGEDGVSGLRRRSVTSIHIQHAQIFVQPYPALCQARSYGIIQTRVGKLGKMMVLPSPSSCRIKFFKVLLSGLLILLFYCSLLFFLVSYKNNRWRNLLFVV